MAFFKAKGTITYKSEVKSGISKKTGNEWSQINLVISLEGGVQPYDKIAPSAFGEKCIDASKVEVGDFVEFEYSLHAREYQGVWYNSVGLSSIEVIRKATTSAPETHDPRTEVKEDMPF